MKMKRKTTAATATAADIFQHENDWVRTSV